jgi:hypothetical protein
LENENAMKKIFLGLCSPALLSGCPVFKQPSADRMKSNENGARATEARSTENTKADAINAQTGIYERQGLSAKEARARAETKR